MLETYCRTEVTFPEDRLVALAGVVSNFKWHYPELKDTVYNSGIWLCEIRRFLNQLLWFHGDRGHRLSNRPPASQRYPIPSWSPLSCNSMFWEAGIHQANVPWLLPLGDVRVSEERLDKFGRVQHPNRCELRLKGVLVPIKISDSVSYDSTRILARDSRGEFGHASRITWDSMEELQAARSRQDDERYLHALILGTEVSENGFIIIGIALRPYQNGSPLWSRCGYIWGHHAWHHDDPNDSTKFCEQWQLGKYGFTWVRENPEVTLEAKRKWQLRPTGLAPELEDIVIV